MTVKEVVLLAAEELGLGESVAAHLSGGAEGERETAELLRAFNLVENEIALDYLPLYSEEEIESETGVIRFDGLSRAAVRILRVCDEYGNKLPFRLFPEWLKTQAGKVKIAYTYSPKEKGLEDKSDYVLQASPRLLAYGIAAEYSLTKGLFEEAAVWDKKYKDALTAAYRARPSRILRSRRWA
ncbi:MAG: hypothetical protein IJY62_05560 [Clostridia bacterium]|nr:hypothetical protein [Clostridia bacterium]